MSPSDADMIRQIEATGLGLHVLLVRTVGPPKDWFAVVSDPLTDRRYKWPGLSRWTDELILPVEPPPVEVPPARIGQLSLF